MTHQSLYPIGIGVFDIGFGVLLFMIAPLLGVAIGAVGVLVVGAFVLQQLAYHNTTRHLRDVVSVTGSSSEE